MTRLSIRKSFLFLSVATIFTSGLYLDQSVAAASPTFVGIVDMQLALRTVDQGKRARNKLEKVLRQKEKRMGQEEANLRKAHQEFQKQAVVMSPEARTKKQAELQQRFMKFQEDRVKTQNELQKQERQLTEPIIKKLRELISQVAKKRGYTVILEKNENNVLFSRSKDEITKEVIDQYNKKHKT